MRSYLSLHRELYGPQRPAKIWAGVIGQVLLLVLIGILAAAAMAAA